MGVAPSPKPCSCPCEVCQDGSAGYSEDYEARPQRYDDLKPGEALNFHIKPADYLDDHMISYYGSVTRS